MPQEPGQKLWLDTITRDLLDTGTLARYIDGLSITGLPSNPPIFHHAITHDHACDAAIGRRVEGVVLHGRPITEAHSLGAASRGVALAP